MKMKHWRYEVDTGNKMIYVENLKHDEEDRFPSLDTKIALEEVKEVFKMNGGRILKVSVTLSHNIYRDDADEVQTITIKGVK